MKSDFKFIIKTLLAALAAGIVGFFVLVLALHPVFTGQTELPQHAAVGGFHIQYYGLILAIAALAGYWLLMRRRNLYGINQDDAESIFFAVLIAGFIGARLYHVVSEYPYYLMYPGQIVAVWNGGLSIFGAGLGGILGLLIYRKFWSQYNWWQLLDWIVPSVVLGQIIGRFGNFVNYEIYGLPTTLPWKMFVPVQFRVSPFEVSEFFHPLFLYEAGGSAVILVLLLRLRLKPGYLFLLWLFLYNGMRFFLENLRVGSVIHNGIRVNAVVALILAGCAIFLWYRLRNQYALQNSSHN